MILGVDQGTTGTTAILLNDKGQLKAKHTERVPIRFPKPGWVEQDPRSVYESVEKAIWGVLSKSNSSPKRIKAIGLTNQRETVSIFDKRKALHPFIVWQDRRTAQICQKLSPQRKLVQRESGTPIDPYFSSTKINWILSDRKISRRNKDLRFRTIDSFLIREMTGEDFTEISNAHRTQLLNIRTGKWDSNLFSAFDIPKHLASEVLPSEAMKLKTKGMRALPDGIPIQAVLGDQQAALFGQLGWKQGSGKITFGTGSFILLNTGKKAVISKNKLVGTIALQWASGEILYALEGSVFICGAWIQWLREQLKIINDSSESEILARKVSSSDGVFVIPALTGMGAPFWNAHLKGSIQGLTRGSNRNHIARASLEALCFQNRALIDAMRKDLKLSKKIKWKVDGGAVSNNLLMQIQSDILQETVERPVNTEATAIGAALLAAKAEGLMSLSDIEKSWKKDRVFLPAKKNKKIYDRIYDDWFSAVSSSSTQS